ncbi:putative transcription factor HSF-type-DNA-binding family [Dioscorea sansibarensis]
MEGGGGGAAVGGPNAGLVAGGPPPFLSKTYDMVDDPATDAVVSWGPGNNSFVVWNTPEFARDLLPKYFKHNNFSSFVRQLNTYGFRKVDPDRWEFANEGFLRGQKHLLKTINRRKPSQLHSQPQQPQAQNTPVASCVEVGKFGLEGEIEWLKRDKAVLMKELVMLRQQQQTTDHQLQTLSQRLQGMEQRQQQMTSFLAKAIQSPGFLAQFVQQNESNRRISEGNKKRRLPKQEEKMDGERSSPSGQIIKYQPLMNEAAKAMLMQILKMDSTPLMESMGDSSGFLIKNYSSSMDSMDAGLSNRNSGVTLSEMPTSTGVPYMPVSSGFSVPAQIQGSAGMSGMVATTEMPDISMLSSVPEVVAPGRTDMNIPEFSPLQGIVSGSNISSVPGTNSLYMNPASIGLDGEEEVDDSGIDIFNGEQKLPDINDSFWEQFLSVSPISRDTAESDSEMLQAKETLPEVENVWDSARNMAHLTEQLGLLTSESKV